MTGTEPACWSWTVPQWTDDRFLAFHVGAGPEARCAICGRPERKLVDDHDHRTGLRRGLLCRSCNVSEGAQPNGLVFVLYRRRNPATILDHREYYVGRDWPEGWWTQPGLAQMLTGDPRWTSTTAPMRPDDDPLRALTGMPANTRRVYEAAWHRFAQWCELRGITPLPVDQSTVLDYLSYLTFQTAMAPTSARVAVAAIAHMHRVRSGSPAWQGGTFVEAALKAMAHTRRGEGWTARAARALSAAEVSAVQAAADADGPRSSALIALLAGAGARIADTASAQVQDVVQGPSGPVLRRGNGRDLPLSSDVYLRVQRYLSSRGASSGPLIATETGQAIQTTQVRRIVLRCAVRAGVDPQGLSPFSMRRTGS